MENKEKYIEYLHKKIDEWNSDIDKLMQKADDIDQKSRTELDDQIRILKGKRNEIKMKMKELSHSSDGAWKDIKSGMDLAGEAMGDAVKSAFARFFK